MLQFESALLVFMHPFLPSYCFSFEGMSAPYMAWHYLGLTLSNAIHALADYSNGNKWRTAPATPGRGRQLCPSSFLEDKD